MIECKAKTDLGIYLDHAATTPVLPEVIEIITETLYKYGNPSSIYGLGKESKRIIQHAREIAAASINCDPEEIIFTSGASESNSLAINGYKNNVLGYKNSVALLYSAIEHKSTTEIAKGFFGNDKYSLAIRVNKSGLLDQEALRIFLNAAYKYHFKAILTVQYANNEIGTIQDIKSICKIAKSYNAILHVDATQMYGEIPIDVKALEIDMMSISGHKIGAPKGIGFLYVSKDIQDKIIPIIPGTQENGLRGGTENVPYIAGLGKAIELIDYTTAEKKTVLRDYLINQIETRIPGSKLNGSKEYRLSNNVNIIIPGIDSETLVLQMDMKGVYISSGSACNSNSIESSYVLRLIGLTDIEARQCIRITIGSETTVSEIDRFVEKLLLVVPVVPES